jgi:hypothetical protein
VFTALKVKHEIRESEINFTRVEGCIMSTRITKVLAATAMAVSVGVLAAPAASAETTPSDLATPVWGSVVLCFPLGSVVWCI